MGGSQPGPCRPGSCPPSHLSPVLLSPAKAAEGQWTVQQPEVCGEVVVNFSGEHQQKELLGEALHSKKNERAK